MPTYDPILDTEIAASQPITSSLITRLRNNPLTLITMEPYEVTASGNYNVPTGVTLLMVICVGGGGGGGGGASIQGGQGGSSGAVKCGFFVPSGSTVTCTVGGVGNGGGANHNGIDGGDTDFGSSIVAKGGFGGSKGGTGAAGDFSRGPLNLGGIANASGEQRFSTGGNAGVSLGGLSTHGGGGGAAGVPWFLRTSSLGNGGNGSGSPGANGTGHGAGGGGGVYWGAGGNGTAGIIFVFPLQG